ncbi:glycogen debranching protein GlgX [Aquabacter spiritensis]|uniref:Glycogen operon protein n=1 Tax=Aquabacter spiritensis TaxID=933073 RepID=A0A4R3M307_9HYPH|nr:glycogen debranching protein GlgX [Aquabacter spiritensis]TCT05535.1 glycogen operon protein [Aquabacter spiritensis]
MTLPPLPDRLDTGRPYPLGATPDGLGTNFAVFSANAEKIELCLFDPRGRREVARLALPECTEEVWHGYLPGAFDGLIYGYRAHGPYDPARGHRFNPAKLLIDPYARQLSGALRWSDTLFAYRMGGGRGDLSIDRRDSAPAVPKGVVVSNWADWGDDRPPDVPWSDTVIYETHVRGVSMRRQDVRPHERGTFAALAHPRFIDHLLRIGVTAVELMPIHAFLQDHFLVERGLRNYWGYSTLSFFAPEPAFLSTGSLQELRAAVRRLHAAGIEVILDVVYNHTCEGNELGPTFSFKGLDNASYYRLVPGNERYYINDTGCGNTVNLSHPRVLQMVMDSLRYWVEAFHVDGFRFDLGVTLGREGTGFDPGSGFFDAVRQDPVLARCKLIAEPWDIGPDGYQLGRLPPGFVEWNDRFRDSVRRFWKRDPGMRGEIAGRLSGSSDAFDRRHRKPWASINYVASHDGFTLADVVAYNEKHNAANGEDGRDGHDANYSFNWGAEGPTDDPNIRAVRSRVTRAMLATVMFAQGTPMLLAGDEFGRTQNGNNNAYCQDNEISWIDWELARSPDGRALTAFVARLAEIRKRFATLRAPRFLHAKEEFVPGLRDIGWFDEHGAEMPPEGWHLDGAHTLALRRAGRTRTGGVEVLLLLLNASANPVTFKLPGPALTWRLLVDSASGLVSEERAISTETYLEASSVRLLAAFVDPRPVDPRL